jgi:hypothetical protein
MDYAEGRSDSEMLLTYSGSTLPAGKSLTEMLHVSAGDEGLQNPGAKNRIYEVAIEVYRTKDGGGAATYEAEELLTTLDGTKIE